jgi:hypothetical protein
MHAEKRQDKRRKIQSKTQGERYRARQRDWVNFLFMTVSGSILRDCRFSVPTFRRTYTYDICRPAYILQDVVRLKFSVGCIQANRMAKRRTANNIQLDKGLIKLKSATEIFRLNISTLVFCCYFRI